MKQVSSQMPVLPRISVLLVRSCELCVVSLGCLQLILRSDHFFLQVFSKINRFSWPVIDQDNVYYCRWGTILGQFLGIVCLHFLRVLWFRSWASSQIDVWCLRITVFWIGLLVNISVSFFSSVWWYDWDLWPLHLGAISVLHRAHTPLWLISLLKFGSS